MFYSCTHIATVGVKGLNGLKASNGRNEFDHRVAGWHDGLDVRCRTIPTDDRSLLPPLTERASVKPA